MGEPVSENMQPAFPNTLEKFGRLASHVANLQTIKRNSNQDNRRHSLYPSTISRMTHPKKRRSNVLTESNNEQENRLIQPKTTLVQNRRLSLQISTQTYLPPTYQNTITPSLLDKILTNWTKNMSVKLIYLSMKNFFTSNTTILDLNETYETLIFKIIQKQSELGVYKIKNYDYQDDPSLRNAAVLANLARMRELQKIAESQKEDQMRAKAAQAIMNRQILRDHYLQMTPQNVTIDDHNTRSIFYETVRHENCNASIPNIDGIRLCDPT